VGDWYHDADNYNFGCIGILDTARDMAKFGLIYLNNGNYEEKQVLSADWVRDSLLKYSPRSITVRGSYGNFHDRRYGYQWWSDSSPQEINYINTSSFIEGASSEAPSPFRSHYRERCGLLSLPRSIEE